MQSPGPGRPGGGKIVLEDKPNKDIIERAEDLILRLREVQSARIYADEQGAISEIHVVAVTDRAPKLIARDVESCLKATLGLTIDYRKIGVVVIDPAKDVFVSGKSDGVVAHGAGEAEQPVIDLDHVTRCHPVAAVLLDSIIDEVTRRGIRVVTVDRRGRGLLSASAEFPTRSEAMDHLAEPSGG